MPENSVKIILEAADKTKDAFESLKSSSGSLVSTLKEHWVAISAAAIGSIYAIKKAFDFGKEIASNLNDIKRQAEMIGITTTEYQKLSFAAKMSDVSNESLRIGMRGLSLSMAQFVDQAGDGYDTLMALGLSAVDATGKQKPLNQMFMEIADKFATYADGAAKVDYANKLMGRSGMDLITMLNKGKEGITAYGDELVKMSGVLGDVVVQKGSEAEDTFKRLEVRSNSLKISIGALALEFAKWGEKTVDKIGGVLSISKEADEMELKNLKAWLEYGKEQGVSLKYIENYERRILELETKLSEVKAPSWVKEWVAEFKGKPEMPKLVTPPEPDWIKKWVAQWDELKYSFEQLGIVSEESLRKAAESANTYMETIKKAFLKGKASVNDYKAALIAAANAMQKLVAPDVTNAMADLQKKYEEGAKGISREDPEFRKKIEAWADQINEEMKKILGPSVAELEANVRDLKNKIPGIMADVTKEISAHPLKPIVDTSGLVLTINKAYMEVKRQIESNPIKVNVEQSEGGSSSGYAQSQGISMPGMPGFESNLSLPVNYDFTATGMSPKMPLGDAIKKLFDKFGDIGEVIKGMEAEISFDKVNIQLRELQKQLEKYQNVEKNWLGFISSPYTSAGTHMGSSYDDFFNFGLVRKFISDIQSQIDLLKKEQTLDVLKTYFGSYQTGMPYVPKTGLYMLHKGEEVRTTNQVSMSMGGNTFIINGARDPMAIAGEIERILKYNLHGGLSDAVKRLK